MSKETHSSKHNHSHEAADTDEVLSQLDKSFADPQKMKYWRSIEHQTRTKAYVDYIKDEFKAGDSEISGLDRRDMLKIMGASIALSGVGVACRRPVDNIMPYSKAPEDVIPGISNYFATARPSISGAVGLVMQSHEGRPTKVEGNKEHPFSSGAASTYDQAAVLELYDPDRSRVPMRMVDSDRLVSTWTEWDVFAQKHFAQLKLSKGKGLVFLLNGEDAPTVERLQKSILAQYPEASFHEYNPLALDNTENGAEIAFGKNARVRPLFSGAKILLTIHADPFMSGPGALQNAKGFSLNRKIYSAKDATKMNRLYAVEAAFSVTGTNADHRMRLSAAESGDFLKAVAKELTKYDNLTWHKFVQEYFSALPESKTLDLKFVSALAKDLAKNKGQSLIVVGDNQPAAVHALAHMLNEVLGGLNKTFTVYKTPNAYVNKGTLALAQLSQKINAGTVDTLVMLGVNPVYASAGTLNFAQALKKVKTVIHSGLYDDETANVSTWHLPGAHFLESWSDARAYEGTASIIQPLIAPLHDGRSTVEILAQTLNPAGADGFAEVKKTWFDSIFISANEKSWRRALHDGVIAKTQFLNLVEAKLDAANILQQVKSLKNQPALDSTVEVIFNADYSVLDGSLANLSWLQELPDPITKLTWDNVVLVSQAVAQKFKINSKVNGRYYQADRVLLTIGEKNLDLPAFIMPGLADNSVIVTLGYGRTKAGFIGNNVGVDVYPLLPADGSFFVVGVTLTKTGDTYALAATQEQFAMNGDAIMELDTLTLHKRDPARVSSTQDYENNPEYVKKIGLPASLLAKVTDSKIEEPVQMVDPWPYTGNKWGMVIDLTSCIGCNACVTACQSENNIPVVGKTQVMRSRAMHWIRVDRYFTGEVKNPQSISQPVPCMHCENAPCEPVCPVAATVHDTEGLNSMAYNRCVGTRYCGNNCPYKVRKFNYLDFTNSGNLYVAPLQKERNTLLQMQKNPNVTIRYRGVMEKCTYCTQRIQEAKIAATRNKQNSNMLPDGAVTPACEQTCPTNAITFGNLNDPNSRVTKLKQVDRNYDLLQELNVRPRTSYLAKLRNPNPELV